MKLIVITVEVKSADNLPINSLLALVDLARAMGAELRWDGPLMAAAVRS